MCSAAGNVAAAGGSDSPAAGGFVGSNMEPSATAVHDALSINADGNANGGSNADASGVATSSDRNGNERAKSTSLPRLVSPTVFGSAPDKGGSSRSAGGGSVMVAGPARCFGVGNIPGSGVNEVFPGVARMSWRNCDARAVAFNGVGGNGEPTAK